MEAFRGDGHFGEILGEALSPVALKRSYMDCDYPEKEGPVLCRIMVRRGRKMMGAMKKMGIIIKLVAMGPDDDALDEKFCRGTIFLNEDGTESLLARISSV